MSLIIKNPGYKYLKQATKEIDIDNFHTIKFRIDGIPMISFDNTSSEENFYYSKQEMLKQLQEIINYLKQ